MVRDIKYVYRDPLDVIWLQTARELGWTIERASDVFAAWDGAGRLTVGTPETLDPDDNLGQMIFHEVCHAICEGAVGLGQPDWGLDAESIVQIVREHACLRLQAAIAGRHGLRAFLATTTDFREYYEQLPEDPLADGADPALPIAREAMDRYHASDWFAAIENALMATSQLQTLVSPFAADSSLWSVGNQWGPE